MGLFPRQWPKVGHGAVKQQLKKKNGYFNLNSWKQYDNKKSISNFSPWLLNMSNSLTTCLVFWDTWACLNTFSLFHAYLLVCERSNWFILFPDIPDEGILQSYWLKVAKLYSLVENFRSKLFSSNLGTPLEI